MKLSVSLPAEDVAFVDEFVERTGEPSRSSAIQRAIALLRAAELEDEYAAAFDEVDKAETAAWDRAVADGLDDNR
ncbi:MAG: ribbon-helix-helix protein, CopG family [Actinophytocola sp.]|uniref:ribbon-helix-helix domain-containing protein n=1 Tax=Actinophytocola sp. TaxID=1872138 RepID=UPI0013217481|nr:ribbon-helix-helix domain-containing protein [Actinophytocola sp.]MPZ80432.1 ribbon-helix-helix protein, CopG family [Actinophytocola sp.]